MRILSIETSCDETGLAILDCEGGVKKPRFKIVKEVVASQIKIHRPWGGVVPNLAKREHIRNLPILFGKISGISNFQFPISNKFSILQDRKLKDFFKKIDAIAVTVGPGLEPALWTGITFAKELSKEWKKPLLGANHMEGHLYSVLLAGDKISRSARNDIKNKLEFPAIALIVSGGHTILLRMDSMLKWKKLGETRDDAAGEAFDKVARLLDLPYPGGPQISKVAVEGNPRAIPFPQPMLHSKDYDFSFSGLKTAVLYYLRDNLVIPAKAGIQVAGSRVKPGMTRKKIGNDKLKADVAASFEYAAVNVLAEKTFRAVKEFGAKSVWLSGGVAANKLLRKELAARGKKSGVPIFVADRKHNTDNAAMIAIGAYMQTLRKKRYPLVARGDMQI